VLTSPSVAYSNLAGIISGSRDPNNYLTSVGDKTSKDNIYATVSCWDHLITDSFTYDRLPELQWQGMKSESITNYLKRGTKGKEFFD
jgi:hypothetical protein